jgi:Fe-Mn family superoxide dismutase
VNASTGSPLTSTSSFSQSLASSPLGSFSSLVSHFSAHVAGLHPSSGAYVWLVMDGSKNLGVVGTYAGGTVLVHQRMQVASGAVLGERVLGEPIAPTIPVVEGDSPSTWVDSPSKKAKSPASSSSTFANILKPEFMAPVAGVKTGAQLYPLTCISVHPHCYLKDYGLWGREEYVKNWWSAVDWGAVERNFDAYAAKNTRG